VNNKVYIGVHSTVDLLDNYLGSGKLLKLAIKKYGRSNFSREILQYCHSKEEAFMVEKSIVNDLFTCDRNNYNLAEGGKGNNGINRRSREVLIYDNNLCYITSCSSATKAKDWLGACNSTTVTKACKNAADGKASQVKGYYVCYYGDTPRLRNFDYLVARRTHLMNVGKRRPDHSSFMRDKAIANPTGMIYFTPHHPSGTNRSTATSYYTVDMISAWMRSSDTIISKCAITKLTKKLGDKISPTWIGKTKREIGFYCIPRD
jgi:hypothetical protein